MKDRDSECREFQELVPLWLNRNLDLSEIERLQAHLRKCPECMRRFTVERCLFAEARSGGKHLLPADVDSTLLDRYVFEPQALSSEDKRAVEAFLAESEIALDMVEKLEALPAALDDLAPARERQNLDRLEDEFRAAGQISTAASTVTDVRPGRWGMWAAAAAAVILVAIVAVQVWLGEEPTARLEVTLPATVRGGAALSFTTPASPFVLDARMYIGPEAGHTYDIELIPARSDSALLMLRDFQAFDRSGFADFSLPLDTGRYRVRIYDMYQGDTLVITRPFEVRLAP